jgi:hypothetical protein
MLRRLNVLMGVLALVVAACGGDDPPTGPDPSVAPFVGTWEATTFTVTSIDDPPEMRDLLSNGSFTINVQPSGLYTATLLLGELEIVSDGVLILRPDGSNPCPASSEYSFSGPDQVTLRGPTCVDFNLDGTDEDAVALIVLMRS